MTEIKSALELALERTQDIQGDKETLKANELRNKGKLLASAYLNPHGNHEEKDPLSRLKSYSGKELGWVKEGFFRVMVANINLPVDADFVDKVKRVEDGLHAVLREKRQISYMFQQVREFFEQYLGSRDQMEESVKQQYEPQMREKERLLAQQMGAEIHLSPESDPEFVSLLAKNFSRLEEQYNQALQQVKDQLKQLFDATQ
ncbi:MAG: hypothetical protein CMN78_04535 [Spirochaetales bacterium]|nr:hypothetical protein [Spirochaetales bacterium]